MKIDINTLKEGDKVFWNKGKVLYEGEFVRQTSEIIDLKAFEVKMSNGEIDEIIDIFLITESEYQEMKSRVAAPKVKKEKVPKVKKEKTVKEKVAKIVTDLGDVKATIGGLNSLLAKDNISVTRGAKWYQYNVGDTHFEYKGALRDMVAAAKAGGYESLMTMNQTR